MSNIFLPSRVASFFLSCTLLVAHMHVIQNDTPFLFLGTSRTTLVGRIPSLKPEQGVFGIKGVFFEVSYLYLYTSSYVKIRMSPPPSLTHFLFFVSPLQCHLWGAFSSVPSSAPPVDGPVHSWITQVNGTLLSSRSQQFFLWSYPSCTRR